MRRLLGINAGALILGCAICAIPIESRACVICLHKNLWNLFPPIGYWSAIGIIWFIAYSLLATIDKKDMAGMPTLLGGIVWLGAGIIAWAAFLSYIALAPFLLVCLSVWFNSWSARKKDEGFSCLPAVRGIGIIAIILMMITGFNEYANYKKMTPADFILQDRTSDARGIILKLKKEEPASIGEYRKIIAQGDYKIMGYINVMDRLSLVGDAGADMPLLMDVLARMEQNGADSFYRQEAQRPLRKLSGLTPPENATSAEWRKLWHAKSGKP